MLRRFSKKRNSSKNAIPQNSESKTLLNKFLDFITSSIWSIPIASFIEQQSIVFDRQQMEVEVYEQIHKEYASLIDTLIECFCEDVSTSSSNLTEALKLLEQKNLSLRQKVSLEPLAAAQDFNVFVPMMMRKNIELQLQALQMIEFMCGLIPAVLQIEDGETLKNRKELSPEDTERYVLISVLRQSRDEFDAMQKGREEMQLLAREGEQQRLRLEDEIRKEEQLLKMALARRTIQTGTDNETPLSVAAIMYSQMTDSSTNTEQNSSIGTSTDRSRPTTANNRQTSTNVSTETDNMNTQDQGTRPMTVKITKGTYSKSSSANIEDIDAEINTEINETTTKSRPSTAKRRNSRGTGTTVSDEEDSATGTTRSSSRGIGTDPIDSKDVGEKSRPGTAKKKDSKGTETAVIDKHVAGTVTIRKNSTSEETGAGTRPGTAKRRDSKGTETNIIEKEDTATGMSRPATTTVTKVNSEIETETSGKSRPGTSKRRNSKVTTGIEKEHAGTGTGTEMRPGTGKRRDSKETATNTIVKADAGTGTDIRPETGKRRDSKETERPRTKSKTRNGESKKPPMGPVKEPKYPKYLGEERKYIETPGMEHGPRRKNLNDVNSHLVDRDRLNSSDVRARAEYLREQRDRLLQLKREERIKQMNELTKNPLERPKTAQAARGIMDKKEAEEIRREINQKIKTEILTLQ